MSKGGFLDRWSRRKLTSDRTEEPETQPEEAETEALAPAAAEETSVTDEPDEEALDEAELARLPAIEEISVKTDLAPFLRKGVPDVLKNAALRRMWMLDPAIRDHVDFAVDYAWDWNVPGGVPGNAGTISGKSLAKMLESLKPKPVESPAASLDQPPDPATQETAVEADRDTQAPEEAPDTSESDVTDTAPVDSRTTRPRRHGGAAPV